MTEPVEPTIWRTPAGATVLEIPGGASIVFALPEPSVRDEEALWAEFVRNAPRTPEVYRNWRRGGTPVTWLARAGFPYEPVRLIRGRLP